MPTRFVNPLNVRVFAGSEPSLYVPLSAALIAQVAAVL